jgi:hypothetical protein
VGRGAERATSRTRRGVIQRAVLVGDTRRFDARWPRRDGVLGQPVGPARQSQRARRRRRGTAHLADRVHEIDQRASNLVKIAWPQRRILGQKPMDQAREILRNPRHQLGEWPRLVRDQPVHGEKRRAGSEWPDPCECLVQQHAEREQVGAMIDRLTERLLG